MNNSPDISKFEVIFLGTGVSTAIPTIQHLLDSNICSEKLNISCKVCSDAYNIVGSKNKRNNVSICVSFYSDGIKKCIMIDYNRLRR